MKKIKGERMKKLDTVFDDFQDTWAYETHLILGRH